MKIVIKSAEGQFSYVSNSENISIGRDPANDFVVPLSDFSRKHFQVRVQGNYHFIIDLGSKNGVMVDGQRIAPHIAVPVYPYSMVMIANLYECELFEGQCKERVALRLEK